MTETSERWAAVDDYLMGKLVPDDPALGAAREASIAAGLPGIEVSPLQGQLLAVLIAGVGATRVLEIGTLGGYSAIWMARALAPGGRLISLEAEPRFAEVAKSNVERAGLVDSVDIWIGPALDLLPKIAASAENPFDFTFIDADKQSIPEYFDWAVKLSRPGALIVVDNVVRGGRLIDKETSDPSVDGVRRFHDSLQTDRRVQATTIQTVGAKGYDGLTLAVVGET